VGDKDPITKNLIGVIEEFRASFNNLYDEVELVKNYIHDAFGDDSSLASSQGAKGDRGLRGYKGNIGNQGPVGADGATGNSHLSNVTSIGFNSKGQLEVVISGTTKKFNAAK